MSGRGEDGRTAPRPSPRNKRAEIVAVATEYFGETGYEDTRWADVATAVGLGPTALYHYFESKQQCLFEILVEAIEEARADFLRHCEGDFGVAFPTVIRAAFERTDREARRARVLVAEQGLVRHPRPAPREENARLLAYSLPGVAHGAGPQPPNTVNALRWVFNQVWGTHFPMLPTASYPDGDYPYQWEPLRVAK